MSYMGLSFAEFQNIMQNIINMKIRNNKQFASRGTMPGRRRAAAGKINIDATAVFSRLGLSV
ncbi:MAG: hypothetical protein EGQ84_01300 [Slackia sp.]|nr:hypothetical protein [Slackia sp.]